MLYVNILFAKIWNWYSFGSRLTGADPNLNPYPYPVPILSKYGPGFINSFTKIQIEGKNVFFLMLMRS